MKRGFSILLILLFSLGPSASALGIDVESHLPACCRRHGAHHCEMDQAGVAAYDGAVLKAPSHCPIFPRTLAPLVQWPAALAADAVQMAGYTVQSFAPAGTAASHFSAPIRTHEVRGPPDSHRA